MKSSLASSIGLLSLVGALFSGALSTSVSASEWAAMVSREGLSEAEANKLLATSGDRVVVKTQGREARSQPGVRMTRLAGVGAQELLVSDFPATLEVLDPLFREYTLYRLTNGSPADVAGAFANYPQYGRLFARVLMESATRLRGSEPAPTPGRWVTDVHFEKAIVLEPIIPRSDGRRALYDLRNVWTTYNSVTRESQSPDSYRVVWSIIRSATPVHFVEGLAEFEPVTLPTGEVKTLIKYYNYINPLDNRSESCSGGTIECGAQALAWTALRGSLGLEVSERQNRTELVTLMNILGDEAGNANSSIVRGGRSEVCSHLALPSCSASAGQ